MPANVPYTRYFLAAILQFQFHRALAKTAGLHGAAAPLLDLRNKAAGEKLKRCSRWARRALAGRARGADRPAADGRDRDGRLLRAAQDVAGRAELGDSASPLTDDGMASSLLFGTNIHPATGDAARRQIRAMAVLRDLSPMSPVNLQFADRGDLQEFDGFDTLFVLQQDSNRVSGRPGVRKPVVNELFTRLAEAAVERDARYFGFTNSDIVFTPAAIERVQQGDRPAYLFARTDFDPGTERDTRPLIYGTDVFVVETTWWLSHQQQFRPYIVGEGCWDNVYTAQLLCWAGGLLLNREPLVNTKLTQPYGETVRSANITATWRPSIGCIPQWAIFADQLESLRGPSGELAPAEAEIALQTEVFQRWRPTVVNHLVQLLRVVKLMMRQRFVASRTEAT